MKIPKHLLSSNEWTLIGPMGPQVPTFLLNHSLLGIDGGSLHTSKLDVWVGDSDSGMPLEHCPVSFRFSSDKSTSDLALGLSLIQPIPRLKLHLWGFTGGRIDHELINIGECLSFLEHSAGSEIWVYSDSGQVVFKMFGKGHWCLEHHGLFSLVVLKPIQLTLTGACTYQVSHLTEFSPLSSLGLSNHAHGQVFLENHGPAMFVFAEHK